MNFTQFRDKDRNNINMWLREFNRTGRHITDQRGLDDMEYCTMLVQACSKTDLAGKKLRRMQDKDPVYK